MLVNVLVLWLNSLFFSSLVGIVVVLSVMNGLVVCGDLWCSVCVISFLLVLVLLLISIDSGVCVSCLIVWNSVCIVGVLFISCGCWFGVGGVVGLLGVVSVVLGVGSMCCVSVIVLFRLNGLDRNFCVLLWNVLVVLVILV